MLALMTVELRRSLTHLRMKEVGVVALSTGHGMMLATVV